MIDKNILLLTYYYSQELAAHRMLRYVGPKHLGAYLPFDVYLYEPLTHMFSQTSVYDYLERKTELGMNALNEEIVELVRRERPDYLLWTSWQYDISPAAFSAMREAGTRIIGIFFDDEWRFERYSKWMAGCLDYVITNDADAVPKYESVGVPAVHIVPNTGIALDDPFVDLEVKRDISFVGSRFVADREQWVENLQKRQVAVDLFGNGWGRYVTFGEMTGIFRTSRINLNFSKDLYTYRPQIKGRMFQVCMAGGFLLTEYVPGLERYFEIGKEIDCFKDLDELERKIDYYLTHDEERIKIARAGWERARTEYTSGAMLEKAFSRIEEDVEKGTETTSPRKTVPMPFFTGRYEANYHYEWGRTWLEENRKRLAREELVLSLAAFPLHLGALYYELLSFFPRFLRRPLMSLHRLLAKGFGFVFIRIDRFLKSRNQSIRRPASR